MNYAVVSMVIQWHVRLYFDEDVELSIYFLLYISHSFYCIICIKKYINFEETEDYLPLVRKVSSFSL